MYAAVCVVHCTTLGGTLRADYIVYGSPYSRIKYYPCVRSWEKRRLFPSLQLQYSDLHFFAILPHETLFS